MGIQEVKNFNELQQAINDQVSEIIITRHFLCNTSIILPPDTHLKGKPQENGELPALSFSHTNGIGLTCNNHITDLDIQAPIQHKAIYNTLAAPDLGHFVFSNLTLTGQFSFITRTGTQKASVEVNGLDIIAADSRHYLEQPQKYGVNALQGAFTVFNFNSDKDSVLNLSVNNLRIGRKKAPVLGSGLFVSGFGDEGGRLLADSISTRAIYSNGMIPYGVANIISAGVFVVYGAFVKQLTHQEEVVTYGVNDMVLDTWGSVDEWVAESDVISNGPSGVGFVNFGQVKNFTVKGSLETYGQGARGYNQYDGSVENAHFKSIKTFGDGSIGVQVSKKIGKLTVLESVSTYGGTGNSLVKGKNVNLPAIALSVKEEGEVEGLTIGGNIETFGDDLISYQVEGGIVKEINVEGVIVAYGKNSKPVSIEKGGQSSINHLKIE